VIIAGRTGEEGTPYSARRPFVWVNAREQTFATRDPALLRGLLADDSVLVDGYGEQSTGRTWLAQLNESKDTPLNVRSLDLLYQGEATIVIGDEVSTATSLAGRFTRVWTRSPQGMQLRVSQTCSCRSIPRQIALCHDDRLR
jgi:hypothetical protein